MEANVTIWAGWAPPSLRDSAGRCARLCAPCRRPPLDKINAGPGRLLPTIRAREAPRRPGGGDRNVGDPPFNATDPGGEAACLGFEWRIPNVAVSPPGAEAPRRLGWLRAGARDLHLFCPRVVVVVVVVVVVWT